MLHHSLNVVHIRHTYGVPVAVQRLWDILANKSQAEFRRDGELTTGTRGPLVVALSKSSMWMIKKQNEL